MPRGRRPTSKNMVLAKDRERQALELRKAGASYDQIAARMEMSREGVRKSVVRALAELTAVCAEKAAEVRTMESERLDALSLGLWDKARRGDIAAVTAYLKVMDRRARLLGLDMSSDDVLVNGEEEVGGFRVERVDRMTLLKPDG